MRTNVNIAAALLALAGFSLLFAADQSAAAQAEGKTVRGWLTDAACAHGRANGGKFTGGNPDCAKKCVAEGSKIVLALPDQKKLLVVTNPETAKSNVGNFIEATGTIDAESGTIEIRSLKMLEEGRAICALPGKKT